MTDIPKELIEVMRSGTANKLAGCRLYVSRIAT